MPTFCALCRRADPTSRSQQFKRDMRTYRRWVAATRHHDKLAPGEHMHLSLRPTRQWTTSIVSTINSYIIISGLITCLAQLLRRACSWRAHALLLKTSPAVDNVGSLHNQFMDHNYLNNNLPRAILISMMFWGRCSHSRGCTGKPQTTQRNTCSSRSLSICMLELQRWTFTSQDVESCAAFFVGANQSLERRQRLQSDYLVHVQV